MALFELKERAKWSYDPEERKTAIRELTMHGTSAVPSLEEILSVTAYEDIKKACAEAIKDILNIKRTDEISTSNNDLSSKVQKKEEKQEQEEKVVTEPSLADLPP